MILLGVACLTIMVGCVIVPGLAAVGAGLGVTEVNWLVTLPSLGVVIFGPLVGWSLARSGAWTIMAIGLFFYGLLGTAAPLLTGPLLIYADRLLLGAATAAVMASGTTLIAEFWHDRDARLRMIAVQGMAIELGGVVFLALGGWLAGLNWRYPFLIYLLAWVFLAWQVLMLPRPSVSRSGTVGARGARGGTWPLAVLLTAGAAMVVFFTGELALPVALARLGFGSAGIGLFLAFVSLVAVATAWRLPSAVGQLGSRRVFAAAFASYALAFTVFALVPPTAVMVAGGVLLGIAFGLSVPLANHCVIEAVIGDPGPALAVLSMALFLGQFLASVMLLVAGGTRDAFVAAAVIALAVAAAWALLHPKLSRHSRHT